MPSIQPPGPDSSARLAVSARAIRQLFSAKVQGAPSRANAERARDQLAAIDAVLRRRQAEIRAARRLIRSWATEIEDWLAEGTPGPVSTAD